jgi:competence protein ComFC
MAIIDLIFPKKCLNCGKEGRYVCESCLQKVKFAKPICPVCTRASIDGMIHIKCQRPQNLDGLVSFWAYDGVIRKAILGLKYKFALEITKELADLSIEKLKKSEILTSKKLILVPIPLHWHRENWRGFNQVEEIGKLISRKMGWDFMPDLLVRKTATVPQAELKREQRLTNVRDVFALNFDYKIPDIKYTILLFDDVWTTGTTIKEGAKELKKSGFKKVWGMTIAKSGRA